MWIFYSQRHLLAREVSKLFSSQNVKILIHFRTIRAWEDVKQFFGVDGSGAGVSGKNLRIFRIFRENVWPRPWAHRVRRCELLIKQGQQQVDVPSHWWITRLLFSSGKSRRSCNTRVWGFSHKFRQENKKNKKIEFKFIEIIRVNVLTFNLTLNPNWGSEMKYSEIIEGRMNGESPSMGYFLNLVQVKERNANADAGAKWRMGRRRKWRHRMVRLNNNHPSSSDCWMRNVR